MALTKISGDVLQSSINIGVVTASQINVGSAVTIHTGGFRVGSSDLHSGGLTVQNLNSTGVVTATTFSGNLTGNVTGNVTGNATGLSGTPNITVGAITAASAVITGNVSVAGTVTYEDTTNVDSIGVVTARSGIVIGTGTSISSPATNTLTLGTNNAERVRVSAGGVSIGTVTTYGDSNASFTSLSLGGNGTRYGLLEIKQSNSVAGSWIDCYGTNGNGDLRITTAGTSNNITFWTGGAFTEKVRITSSGNLGIGTTNPQSLLEVYGTSASTAFSVNGTGRYRGFEIYSSGTRTAYVNDDSTDNAARLFTTRNNLILGTGDTERARFNSSGNLGIGTNNPQAVLHTVASGEVARFQATSNPYVNFYNGSTNTAYIQSRSSDFRLASSSGIPIVFFPGDGSDKVVVNSYGVSSRNFNRAWEYYNSDNTPRTFTWLNVFNQIYTGTGGRLLQNNGAAYRFYLTGNNGRHLRIYEGVVHIGDIATYGASSNAINVSSISEIVGPFPGGCGNPFSSVSTTGFTYNRGDCFQNANVFLNGLANIYNSIETVTGTP